MLTFTLNKLVFGKCLIELLVAVLIRLIIYRCLIELLWLSLVPQAHYPQVSELFVVVLSSSYSYSTGVWFSFLWLSSAPQAHILLVSELFVVVLSSSDSYSTGVWLSFLWLSSVPQTYILLVSDWAFCGCPQFFKLIFYWCLIKLCSCPHTAEQKLGQYLKIGIINKCSFASHQSWW
jgi:hypothetical protein